VRATVLELVKEVQAQGRTIVLSSHLFSDIDTVCDEVVILRQGALVVRQNMSRLAEHHIVHGFLEPTAAHLEFEVAAQTFEACDYYHLEKAGVEPRIRLHLKGEPRNWLAWLQQQPLERMTIEKAGIRSVYERFHGSEAKEDASENQQLEALHGTAT
jgi:ABC-type multidrug transport system ATPase subunit